MRFLLIILLLPIFSNGQKVFGVPPRNLQKPKISSNHSQRINHLQVGEVCGNGIDDDGNGLADEKDFTCYYSANGTDGCSPSKIIWGVSQSDLYWGDVETGTVHRVGDMNGIVMVDITWASNGKLYATDGFRIYEIDPYTAAATLAFESPDYFFGVSLTSDNEGNLYSDGGRYDELGVFKIIKVNMTTLQISKVADLDSLGLSPAGDLTFLNGLLYLTCADQKMAVINTGTGVVTVFTLQNSTTYGSYGLITLGDGYLYQSDKDKIYKIDPSTMIVSSTPFFDFQIDSMYLLGLSNYTEHCNAPKCKATLNIDVLSATPFCSATGVQLIANGIGIQGEAVYEWTLPDKSFDSQKSIKAVLPGTYYIQYSGVADFCAAKDSIFLAITQNPKVDLGGDKILCDGTTLELVPQASPNNVDLTWNNGSTDSQIVVTMPGTYTVKASNICGSVSDSIVIIRSIVPQVNIGNDTAMCPGAGILLNNNYSRRPEDKYRWSDSSDGDSLYANAPGLYWLESSNVCGISTDSILVSYKDSCTCFPLFPELSLGPDMGVCDSETVTLGNLLHQDGFQYKWSTGSTEQKIKVKGAGVYWVDVSTYCGMVRDSIVLNIKTQGCDRDIFIPLAFTPNNDGKNDIFKPVIFGTPDKYEFAIYNRWGQLVFYTKNIAEAWDGNFRGKRQDSDIFVWICSYTFQGLKTVLKKGTVALIK